MSGGDDGDVDVRVSLGLLLGDDDLARSAVVGVGDGRCEDTDGTDNLSGLLDLVGEVGRVSNNKLAFGDFSVLALHSSNFSLLIGDYSLEGLVEHVRSSVDGRETSEPLWELSKAIEGVDVGGLSISGKRLCVQPAPVNGEVGWLVKIRVVAVECQSMSYEVNGVCSERELGKDVLHGHLAQVWNSLVGLWVARLVVLDE